MRICEVNCLMGLANATDKQNEREVADLIGRAWGWKLHSFGQYSPLDFWAELSGKEIALIELKTRSHPSTQFPTVYFSMRKWMDMMEWSRAFKCPALFVVRFSDLVKFIPLADVDPGRYTIDGRRACVGGNDIEPLILVPVVDMREVINGNQN